MRGPPDFGEDKGKNTVDIGEAKNGHELKFPIDQESFHTGEEEREPPDLEAGPGGAFCVRATIMAVAKCSELLREEGDGKNKKEPVLCCPRRKQTHIFVRLFGALLCLRPTFLSKLILAEREREKERQREREREINNSRAEGGEEEEEEEEEEEGERRALHYAHDQLQDLLDARHPTSHRNSPSPARATESLRTCAIRCCVGKGAEVLYSRLSHAQYTLKHSVKQIYAN
ncbi:hypothetical protein L7F22_010239 [Adiantum nelumboides]|nr:hypothetical protein [Adiantum nelumboides]